jgi:hypothetical protein
MRSRLCLKTLLGRLLGVFEQLFVCLARRIDAVSAVSALTATLPKGGLLLIFVMPTAAVVGAV